MITIWNTDSLETQIKINNNNKIFNLKASTHLTISLVLLASGIFLEEGEVDNKGKIIRADITITGDKDNSNKILEVEDLTLEGTKKALEEVQEVGGSRDNNNNKKICLKGVKFLKWKMIILNNFSRGNRYGSF